VFVLEVAGDPERAAPDGEPGGDDVVGYKLHQVRVDLAILHFTSLIF
jgi:hypothetical protein